MAAQASVLRTLIAAAVMALAIPIPMPMHTGANAANISAERDRTAKIFDLLDDGGDGRISMVEFKNNQMLVFYLLDRNKDVALTRNETSLAADVFARVAGADGKISTLEFLDAVDNAFSVTDADHNGSLNQQEFLTLVQHVREE